MHGVKSNCQTYITLYFDWVNENNPRKRTEYYDDLCAHRVSCPACRREMAELTELAKRAQMPEIELEEV